MSAFKINDRVRVKSTGLMSTGQVGTVISVKWGYYVVVRLDNGTVLNIRDRHLEKESNNRQTTDAVIFQLSFAPWHNDSDPMNPKDVADSLNKFGTESDTFFCVEEVKDKIEERLECWDSVAGFVNGEMFYARKTTTYVGKLFE